MRFLKFAVAKIEPKPFITKLRMQLQERINAFVKLGDFLRQFSNEDVQKADNVEHNDLFFEGFKHQLKLAEEHNGWFTKENIRFALNSWAEALTTENLIFVII